MKTLKNFDPSSVRFSVMSDLDVKAAADGRISGYASTFGGAPDLVGDIVAPGAFKRTLLEQKSEGVSPAMLWHHKMDQPIGKWISLNEDGHGLAVEGEINLNTSQGRDAYEHVKGGSAGYFSIGYVLPDAGRKYNGDGSFTLTDIDLLEISITPTPANRKARIAAVKSLNSKSDLVDLLREAGLARDAAKRVAAAGWSGLSSADHTKTIDLAAQIERATLQLRTK